MLAVEFPSPCERKRGWNPAAPSSEGWNRHDLSKECNLYRQTIPKKTGPSRAPIMVPSEHQYGGAMSSERQRCSVRLYSSHKGTFAIFRLIKGTNIRPDATGG
jgi:hypothetical protein